MLQTNFKSICVYVTYKLNKLPIAIKTQGATVTEIIQLARALLGISQNVSCYLTRNDIVQKDETILFPFTQVTMHEQQKQQQNQVVPNMRNCLWQLAGQVRGWNSSDILSIIAKEIYEEMVFEMQRLAHYGLFEATFILGNQNDCNNVAGKEVFIPPSWLRVLYASKSIYNDRHRVIEYIKNEFRKEELEPCIVDDIKWTFTWKLDASEMTISYLTARDLMSMGFPIQNGDLFRTIHNRLKEAILTGDVASNSLNAQKDWVRKHFKP